MNKVIYTIIVAAASVGLTLAGVFIYQKIQEEKEFTKYNNYLQKEYFPLLSDCADYFQKVAKANSDVELSEWTLEKQAGVKNIKLLTQLEELKQEVINHDVSGEDSLLMKKYVLNSIEGAMRSTRIVNIYNMKDDNYETAEEFDGLFSKSLDYTTKQLNKRNDVMDKHGL